MGKSGSFNSLKYNLSTPATLFISFGPVKSNSGSSPVTKQILENLSLVANSIITKSVYLFTVFDVILIET